MPRGKITVAHALIVLVGLVLLLQLSFWADEKSLEVEGPSRIVKGPQETLYIQIDRKIAKVSFEGEVLNVLDVDTDLAIPEHIADFFVEDDGNLLIARRDSQLLQYYSPEGKLIKTHARIPSELVEGNHFFKFSKDLLAGIIYVADTSHHRIQIFGPDEKETKSISGPSGSAPVMEQKKDFSEENIDLLGTPLHYPNGLIFDQDRLIATDTGNSRIVIFYPDGTLDKIIPVSRAVPSTFTNPIKVGRTGDTVYAVVRGPNFLGGRVEAFDQNTGVLKLLLQSKLFDPWDVFPRAEDVLIADRESLSVLRYDHKGMLIGTFGKFSLQSLYVDRQIARKAFQGLRIGAFASMFFVLGWLLFALRRQRIAYELTGVSMYKPALGVQNFLGPATSVRKKILLLLIPGIGQVAAGRTLRTIVLLMVLLPFAGFVVIAWFSYRENGYTVLPVLMAAILFVYSVWIGIVLDGIRLNKNFPEPQAPFNAKGFFKSVALPFLTVCTVLLAQLVAHLILRHRSDVYLRLTSFLCFVSTYGNISMLVGWGGAGAGMFGVLALQLRTGTTRNIIGFTIGFFAGAISWLAATSLVGSRLGGTNFLPPVEALLLGSFAYLYFRKLGMPLLSVLVAIAAAWISEVLIVLFTVLYEPLIGVLLSWGIHSRYLIVMVDSLERIGMPAFFIHVSIWGTWNLASDRFTKTVSSDQPNEKTSA